MTGAIGTAVITAVDLPTLLAIAVLWGSAAGIGLWITQRVVYERAVTRRARQQLGLEPTPAPRVRPTGAAARTERLPWRRRAQQRRRREIAAELAPALMLMIGHLQIGRGVMAAIAEVAESTPGPLGEILTEAVAESRLGTPLDTVFTQMAQREGEPHLEVLASALALHARHGGSIVEIMQVLTETIEEEETLQRDIRSLTADGRLSARVLMAMPPASLGLISLLSPGYALPLITDPLGRVMTATGVVLGLIGWRWLGHLARPQVRL